MKRLMDMLKQFRLAREEHGSALVEFAVTVPLLIFLLFAVLQGMFAMYLYHYTAWAAQEGARFAMVRGATASENVTSYCEAQNNDIQNYVQSLGAINSSNLTINTSKTYIWPGTNPDGTTTGCAPINSKGCMVRVTATYSFNVIPFLPFSAFRD